MDISSETSMPVEQVLHDLQTESTPTVTEETAPDCMRAASESRLHYLDLLEKLGIPLVVEGSPAEAFLVR